MRIDNIEFSADLGEILNDLVVVMRANNIPYLQKIKETSTHFQVTCPYHSEGLERRPSAGIRKSDGVFHCFACNEVHSLPEVISYCLGHDDPFGTYGWNWLLKKYLSVEVEDRKDVLLDYSRVRAAIEDCGLAHHIISKSSVSEEELASYRYTHPYMYKRKLTDEIIELFDIGYDLSTDCITFPVRDSFGNCLFIARRSVHGKFFNYPAEVEKPLYGLYEINVMRKQIYNTRVRFGRGCGKSKLLLEIKQKLDEIIVCESMLDALTCWVYGKYAIALNGLGSEKQFEMLNQLPCRKYILATDKDEKGRQARERFRKNVQNRIVTEYDYASYPAHAKDINDMSEDEFKNLIEIF